jgi:hypothetical protein
MEEFFPWTIDGSLQITNPSTASTINPMIAPVAIPAVAPVESSVLLLLEAAGRLATLLVGLNNAFMVLDIVVPDGTSLGDIGGTVFKYAYVLVIP